jgi:hypothetical protein
MLSVINGTLVLALPNRLVLAAAPGACVDVALVPKSSAANRTGTVRATLTASTASTAARTAHPPAVLYTVTTTADESSAKPSGKARMAPVFVVSVAAGETGTSSTEPWTIRVIDDFGSVACTLRVAVGAPAQSCAAAEAMAHGFLRGYAVQAYQAQPNVDSAAAALGLGLGTLLGTVTSRTLGPLLGHVVHLEWNAN